LKICSWSINKIFLEKLFGRTITQEELRELQRVKQEIEKVEI